VAARKRLEAQGRSLWSITELNGAKLVEAAHVCRAPVPQWMRELLLTATDLLALQEKIAALTLQLQSAAAPNQTARTGQNDQLVIDRNW